MRLEKATDHLHLAALFSVDNPRFRDWDVSLQVRKLKGMKVLSVYEILRLYSRYLILHKLQKHDHQGVHLSRD